MKKMPELLAPAGGLSQLETAVRFGADAVYGGLDRFGLRSFAGNFTFDTLTSGLETVHNAGKKFYLTLNVFAFDDEITDIIQTAKEANSLGIDGAIVSDPGVFMRLRESVPDLKLHISTQANVMNSETCRFFADLGASRIVLARELSLEQIKHIRSKLPEDIMLETFVHGAMCVSYSGRCLLSAELTGRSGNRGACTQPCRWQYVLEEEKRPGIYMPIEEDSRGTYILSALDLNMIGHLDELTDAGIGSFKIEGRMKSEYYVANIVSAYRRGLDLLKNDPVLYRNAVPQLQSELEKAGHRRSNTGFYYGAPEQPAGADGSIQSMEYIGSVIEQQGNITLVELKNRFYSGDILELLSPEGVFPFTVGPIKRLQTGTVEDTVSVAGELIEIDIPFHASKGDFLRGPNRHNRIK